jgi:hypothetical protein
MPCQTESTNSFTATFRKFSAKAMPRAAAQRSRSSTPTLPADIGNFVRARAPRSPAPPGFIDQLVFAAPDVGLGDFELLEPDAAKLASHVTVYASTGDVAVEASYFVHDYQHRAGNNPKELRAWRDQSNATLDVIDASQTNGDVYGHGYLTRSQMASVDVARALRGENIDQRSVPEGSWPASILCFDVGNDGKPCGEATVDKAYSFVPDVGGESWRSSSAKRLWK